MDPGRVVAVDAQTGWQRLRSATAAGAQTEEWVDPTRVVHVDPRTGWQKVRTVKLAASAFQAAGAAATGGAPGAPGAPVTPSAGARSRGRKEGGFGKGGLAHRPYKALQPYKAL